MSDRQPPRNVDDEDDTEENDRNGIEQKVKRVPFFKLRKVKKLQSQKRKEKGISVNFGGCFVCLKEPQTLDSSGESPTSDPNSKEFSFDMLRALIEKNEFHSKDCNPHLGDDG